MSDARTRLPGLTALLTLPRVADAVATLGHANVVAGLRTVLGEARAAVAAGQEPPDIEDLAAQAIGALERVERRRLRPVVNATGVLLHTNLGRAPLSAAAIAALARAAGATNLEIDLDDARRGGRASGAHEALARLTGAEAALAVNNGAAALVLALSVFGQGREVVISRGEMVEIGGSFRLPSIMEAAGCVLREVGTTNRTHLEDYRRAVDEQTGAVLRVHPSNYRIDGFVHRPTTAEIAEVAHGTGVPFIDDIGSGLLVAHPAAADEPVAAEAIAQGADLVIFSGDKLLGGPQAGILAGRRDLVERCRAAPLARALRLDKLRLAALEATLRSYERGVSGELPVWRMAAADAEELRSRAERLADACGGTAIGTEAVLGGGSTPGGQIPSWGVAFDVPAESLAQRLRDATVPVVARIVDGRLVVDLRSVPPELDEALTATVAAAVAGVQLTATTNDTVADAADAERRGERRDP